MRFVLTVGTSVFSFTPVGDEQGPYPFLVDVPGIHSTARAGAPSGFGATDTPSASVTLLNENKKVAGKIGDPLRAKAEIYDNMERLAFSGTVANIDYGLEMTFQLES